MRFMGKVLAAVVAAIASLALIGVPLYAQVQTEDEIITPTPEFQDHGAVTPWFWIGIQTVFSAGYNIETNAAGFRNYGGDNYTYASFNLAFVDSHYGTPKFYEVPRQLDPDAWTGRFVMKNFTYRLNSWEGGTEIETNSPAWLAEIAGKGARIGFFSQAGGLIGGLDSTRDYAKGNKIAASISGGDKVLNLRPDQLGKLFYEVGTDPTATTYESIADGKNQGAVMYVGYDKEVFNVYLTMLSEGNVESDVSDGKNDGFAGVIDFGISPFGYITDEEAPVTFNISGNAIAGFNFNTVDGYSYGTDKGINTVGFGLKGVGGLWLGQDNLVLSPVIAFDGKVNPDANEFVWKFGGGLTFQFSGMRWVTTGEDWGDLYAGGPSWSPNDNAQGDNFADYRYENNKVLKFAYAQVYAAYSEESDFNLVFRMEEPDGELGAHEKLGAMIEARLYNLAEEKGRTADWEAQGRLSWDFNVNQYLITPYIRAYANYSSVVKLRIGAYANFIPYTGFELCYTSGNLNGNAETNIQPNAYSKNKSDMGRIEFIVILKSDNVRPQVPKRMSDWNYPTYVQHY